MTGAQDGGGFFRSTVALDDGRVLAAGGNYPAGQILRFHPNTATWTSGAAMGAARTSPQFALLPSNRVLVAGGAVLGTAVAAAEIYDAATNTWAATVTALVNARLGHTATRLSDDRVLIAGGGNVSGLVSFAELFSSATGAFAETGQMAIPRSGHTATLLRDGRVLVAGGGATTAELFNPATAQWTTTGAMNAPGNFHQAVALGNGKVLAFTEGWGAEVFDPDAGSWTATGPLIGALGQPGTRGMSSLPDGGVIVCGSFPPTRSCEVYDAAQNAWAQANLMNFPRSGPSLVLMKSGKVLGFAGFANNPDGGTLVPVRESEIFW